MSPPLTLDDGALKCRAAILAHVTAHLGITGRQIADELHGARFTRRDISRALQGLAADGSLLADGPPGHQKYTLGTPVPDSDDDAIAHLTACGDIGQDVLDYCARKKLRPRTILSAKSKEAKLLRAVLIAELDGTVADIARALRVSEPTVRVYRTAEVA